MGMFSFAKDIGDKIFNRDDDKHDAKKEKDHLDMAKKGFVHVDPKKIEQILRDEGGAAGMDPFLKEFGEEMKDEIVKALKNMPNVGQHEDGDYILDDDKDVDISENMNCGCGNTPCDTYGEVKVITVREMAYEETQKFLEESLLCFETYHSFYPALLIFL